ncbi:hypothetical protein UXU46_00040 (plasmid) [Campylobacter jejuni]
MKKIILGLALIASLSSVASAYKITVSQQPIVQPHYEGCVLVINTEEITVNAIIKVFILIILTISFAN